MNEITELSLMILYFAIGWIIGEILKRLVNKILKK